ncbi:hypothetical protein CFP65_0118 [Kitasatospora sp. MMS16-BH015]|uniref:hypothetical protein n=1 Tax=Kitasatospora sp. MMS16-BH015 TaxID=2018025 RepID=UPI000CA0A786|nr:hypothetical protein [Kitasatospora sp. MMS16-BH015]AUG75102.1 hypothetical protein CFP65_0118 [Kitasatospora sp. MMS16-BH015]
MRSVHRRLAVSTTALVLAAGGFVSGTAHAVTAAHSAAGVTAHTASPALLATCSQDYLPLPDPSCTPGALNPSVTQDTIYSTICVSGWTATVRPSTTYTNKLKVQGIAAYGYSDTNLSDYEEDHFIPLELGGAPKDPANLWPEPHSGSATSSQKDGVETKLKNAVCAGKVQLADAQDAIATDWTTALATLGL